MMLKFGLLIASTTAMTSSLILNNLYFVRMQLDYAWTYGYLGYHDHDYEQFLLLDVNLDIVLIFVIFEVFID